MSQWFEKNDQYTIDDALGERAWPRTLSLVRVDKESTKTQSGWGKEAFMRNHENGRFKPNRIISEFVSYGYPFGFIMRGLPMVCADIDGKNGGIAASSILRLPPTLAERSKSGNGYHLFYRVPEAEWDEKYGYAEFPDANGILPGVDIRSIGIVYHYKQQRWNNLEPAPLPTTLRRLMEQKKAEKIEMDRRKNLELSPEDLLIAQDQVLDNLAKSIPAGRRNQTLYAIGCDLYRLRVKDWDLLLIARGEMLGLHEPELLGIIGHIKRYSA